MQKRTQPMATSCLSLAFRGHVLIFCLVSFLSLLPSVHALRSVLGLSISPEHLLLSRVLSAFCVTPSQINPYPAVTRPPSLSPFNRAKPPDSLSPSLQPSQAAGLYPLPVEPARSNRSRSAVISNPRRQALFKLCYSHPSATPQ
ncbi:hypothetical protein TYRP_012796 [Tyrophagus putrescentiae]|nr:hypothetical protein TYRP_012796 [Tyrophagus putrescentiae]